MDGRHTSCIECDKAMFCAWGHRLHVPLKRYIMFCTSCNKLHVKEKEKWEGRQTGCIDRLHNVLRSLEKISSMQKGVSTVEDWIPKDVETSESETLPTGVCGILP